MPNGKETKETAEAVELIGKLVEGSVVVDNPTTVLTDYLNHGDDLVRSSALDAISVVQGLDKRRAAQAVALLANDPDSYYRAEGAATLGRLGQPEVTPTLIDLLVNDPDDLARAQAAEALGYIGARDAVPTLLAALNDEWDMVRNDAAYALGFVGGPEIVEELLTDHLDNHDDVRAQIVATVYRIGDSRGLEQLLTLIDSVDDETLASQVGAIVKDLAQWHQPSSLVADRNRIIESLTAMAERVPQDKYDIDRDTKSTIEKLNQLE